MMQSKKLGPYELIQRIAEGGMAEIYLAKAKGYDGRDQLMAIKMIRQELSEDGELIEALKSEANLSIRLEHPNIVETFDLVEIQGYYFLTMEYVDGYDFVHLIDWNRAFGMQIPFEVSAYIVREICRALEYAHALRDERGLPLHIIHRDISPQNILLSLKGEVKLTDFGIAKANIARQETLTGMIKGKVAYMSPEQAWGDVLDARSDIYSLGLVLYESIAGRPVFEGQHYYEILKQVRSGDISPLSEWRPDVPLDLEAIVMHALERDKANRFQNAREMGIELERFLDRQASGFQRDHLSQYIHQVLSLLEQVGHEDFQKWQALHEEVLSHEAFMARQNYLPDVHASLLFNIGEWIQEDGVKFEDWEDAEAETEVRFHADPNLFDEDDDAPTAQFTEEDLFKIRHQVPELDSDALEFIRDHGTQTVEWDDSSISGIESNIQEAKAEVHSKSPTSSALILGIAIGMGLMGFIWFIWWLYLC